MTFEQVGPLMRRIVSTGGFKGYQALLESDEDLVLILARKKSPWVYIKDEVEFESCRGFDGHMIVGFFAVKRMPEKRMLLE